MSSSDPPNNNNNNDGDDDNEAKPPPPAVKTASVDYSTLPLDWTQLGKQQQQQQDQHDDMPVRYAHDVVEWSPTDEEIYSVGTAGQKITLLGDDLRDVARTNPRLETLILRSHLIKEMTGLETLTQLRLLELYDNMVQSLDEDSLKGCGPSLKTLDMSYNAIRDMTPLRYCSTNLVELYLANNKLKEIRGLSTLTNLKKLDLGANRIRVMDPHELSGLIHLEELWIGKNKIERMDGLEKVRFAVERLEQCLTTPQRRFPVFSNLFRFLTD
jgi:protein phosphatase 1 regulatory subunit 7